MIYRDKTKRLVLTGLFTSMAIVLHIIESMMPIPFIAPGVKLGLANIITVSALYVLSPLRVLVIILMRVLLASIFTGTVLSMAYSMTGGILSFLIMYLLKKTLKEKVGLIGISSAGAVFHNIGQLLTASLMISNIGIISYLPVLSLAGIVTGIFVGAASHFIIQSTRRFFAAENGSV